MADFDPALKTDDELYALWARYERLSDQGAIADWQVNRWMSVQNELAARCRRAA